MNGFFTRTSLLIGQFILLSAECCVNAGAVSEIHHPNQVELLVIPSNDEVYRYICGHGWADLHHAQSIHFALLLLHAHFNGCHLPGEDLIPDIIFISPSESYRLIVRSVTDFSRWKGVEWDGLNPKVTC